MRFKTMRDVLDRVTQFHNDLSDYYSELSIRSDKQRVKLLLDYMSVHEKKINENLDRFEKTVSKNLLDTWFKYIPSSDMLINCREIAVTPDMTIEEVVRIALKLDDCLINFYRTMADKCVILDIKSIFASLAKIENREKLNFVRNAQEIYDF